MTGEIGGAVRPRSRRMARQAIERGMALLRARSRPAKQLPRISSMDRLTPRQRSRLMSRVRAKSSALEMTVRSEVHRMGLRFRLHRADLPGTPDLVFVSRRKVVFVHGCFWHQHSCRRGDRIPATNRRYWVPKLARNRERDAQARRALRKLGWEVLTIWECEIRRNQFVEKLRRFFGAKRRS